MLDSLKDAFTSKKFLAAVVGAIVVAFGQGVGLSDEQSMKISAMVVAYIVGQGVADHGKEKVRLEAKLNGKSPSAKAAALEAEI